MSNVVNVSLTGPSFSFLLYETLKNKNGQEGFLLGEVIETEKRTITDFEPTEIHRTRTVKIHSSIPCPHLAYFYNGIGQIDAEKLKSFLGELSNKVVAWYRFKPNSQFCFTFREVLIHQQLAQIFEIHPEVFTCCLLISELSELRSTLTSIQKFVRFNHKCEEVSVKIVNLSERTQRYKNPEPVSESFREILSQAELKNEKNGLKIIEKIQTALEKNSHKVVKELADAEERLFNLQKEIVEIKKRNFEEVQIEGKREIERKHKDEVDDSEVQSDEVRKGRGRAAKINKGQKRFNPSPGKNTPGEENCTVNTRSRKKI